MKPPGAPAAEASLAPDADCKSAPDPARGAAVSARRLLVLLTLLLLLPFVGKAFNVDDPLFLWAAQQIRQRPGDFYGFVVNWYGEREPMWAVMQNPPAVSYYLALWGAFAGWSEIAMHVAMLVWPLAAILGTYRLARRFCSQPLLASLATLFTPAFLVTSTSVMSDMMMLALWVWSLELWLAGLERRSAARAGAGALLSGAAVLTKYSAVSLWPLLLIACLLFERRAARWALPLLSLPLGLVLGFRAVTIALYGRDLLWGAVGYASEVRVSWSGLGSKAASGLAFVGGCFPLPLLAGAWLWRRRRVRIWAWLGAGAILAGAGLRIAATPGPAAWPWDVVLQGALLALAGLMLLALAARGLWGHRDFRAWFLAFWILEVAVFACFLNWTLNARSILPLVPAAGILIARSLPAGVWPRKGVWLALGGAALVALAVAWADAQWADSARSAAFTAAGLGRQQHARLWFQGHWGFQYYLEPLGGRPVDLGRDTLSVGERMVTPLNNTNVVAPRDGTLTPVLQLVPPSCRWLAVMSRTRGAGFYSDFFGPLPYVVGPVPPETYLLYARF